MGRVANHENRYRGGDSEFKNFRGNDHKQCLETRGYDGEYSNYGELREV